MRPTCLLVLIAAFVGMVAGLSMDKREQFYARDLIRRIYNNNDESMEDDLKSRDVGERVHYRMEKRGGRANWVKIASEEAIADSECADLKIVPQKTLQQCKKICEATAGCNAFNMEVHDKECVLRGCTKNGFPPKVVSWPNYDVWVICKNGQWFQIGTQQAIADDECDNTKIVPTLTLDDCKKICEDKQGCNALNMEVHNKECVLRECSNSEFPPKVVSWANYDSWAICKYGK